MTKYEKLYGVTVDHFPNEKENVKEKLRLAYLKRIEVHVRPYSYPQQVELHSITEAITWAEKILKDIES